MGELVSMDVFAKARPEHCDHTALFRKLHNAFFLNRTLTTVNEQLKNSSHDDVPMDKDEFNFNDAAQVVIQRALWPDQKEQEEWQHEEFLPVFVGEHRLSFGAAPPFLPCLGHSPTWHR